MKTPGSLFNPFPTLLDKMLLKVIPSNIMSSLVRQSPRVIHVETPTSFVVARRVLHWIHSELKGGWRSRKTWLEIKICLFTRARFFKTPNCSKNDKPLQRHSINRQYNSFKQEALELPARGWRYFKVGKQLKLEALLTPIPIITFSSLLHSVEENWRVTLSITAAARCWS